MKALETLVKKILLCGTQTTFKIRYADDPLPAENVAIAIKYV